MIATTFLTLLILSLFTPAFGEGFSIPGTQKNIIGGEDADPPEFPFVAGIVIVGGSRSCTGTLISPDTVLTAAHCVDEVNPAMGIKPFVSFYSEVGVGQRVTIHPDYREDSNSASDIALIHLFDEISIAPVRILTEEEERLYLQKGSYALAVGWGAKNERGDGGGKLRKAVVPILPKRECTGSYTLCAGEEGKVVAEGDSGGPLLVPTTEGWAQIGVTSTAAVNRAGTVSYFGNYIQTSKFRKWMVSAKEHALYFPHYAIGDGWETDLLFMPLTELTGRNGIVQIYRGISKQDPGVGLSRGVVVLGMPLVSRSMEMESGGLTVKSDVEMAGLIRFKHTSGSLVGVLPSPLARGFDIPVSVAPWRFYRVGYAIYNPNKKPVRVSRSLTRRGTLPELELSPGGHVALFIDESLEGGIQEWELGYGGVLSLRVEDCEGCADTITAVALEVWESHLIAVPTVPVD